jgi:hypothetical protein
MLNLKAPGITQFLLEVSNVVHYRVHHEVKHVVNAIFSKLSLYLDNHVVI